jgi:hypothetical protein
LSLAAAQFIDVSTRLTQGASEVSLIPASELEILRSFNPHGRIVLSAYLCLDTPERRKSAYDDFVQHMQARLAECGTQPECRKAIEEDMEIVGLYLKTNGHRRHPGLAIFSCAAELFWRAYPLPTPVPTQVAVDSRFHLKPLLEFAARPGAD